MRLKFVFRLEDADTGEILVDETRATLEADDASLGALMPLYEPPPTKEGLEQWDRDNICRGFAFMRSPRR